MLKGLVVLLYKRSPIFLFRHDIFNRDTFCFLKVPSLSIIYVQLTSAYQLDIHALETGNKLPSEYDFHVMFLVLEAVLALYTYT